MIKRLLSLSILFIITNSIAQQSYYNGIDFTQTGLNLKDDLAVLISNTHTNTLSYSEVWTACKATDENPENSNEVLLIYGYHDSTSGRYARRREKNRNGGGSSDWNREHTYPKSKGTPNLGTSGPGADAHHLRPADTGFNSNRGSKKFADGSGNAGDSNGGWYPGDEWKGDVARMMMYMYVRYNNRCTPTNVGYGSSSSTPDSMIDLFLEWNAEDPPSQIEKNRNTYHENTSNSAAQGNRNPFIDNPRLATQIWGGPNAQDTWGIFGGSSGGGGTDTQAPTVPTNITASNITTTSFDLNWDASTDNTAVTHYNVYVDDNFNTSVYNTSATINNLDANTTYAITIKAGDGSGNYSSLSTPKNITTQDDGSSGGGGTPPSGDNCTEESFQNTGNQSSSYKTITWQGDNGENWTAYGARNDNGADFATDRGLIINSNNGGKIEAPQTTEGIGSLTLSTIRKFSGGSGNLTVFVNGNEVGQIPFSSEEKTTTISDINIEGDVTITIENNASGKQRVAIDNLSWTCYSTTLSNNDIIKKNTTVSPNPFTNKITIANPSAKIKGIRLLDINGKTISTKLDNNTINTLGLHSGIYLLQIQFSNTVITKKLIKL